MPNIASVTKFFATASELFEDNLSSSIAAGATIVPVNSITEYEDGDVVVQTVEPGTANEATFVGTVNGNQFENCVWTEGNTGVGHAAGSTVVDYIAATHLSIMTKGILKEHNQDGTHKHIHADALDVGGVSLSQLLAPTGVILPFGGGAAPTGWLLCQGQAVDRSAYAALFSAIGTSYGVGDGSTTFNLPDARGKVVTGLDTGQTEFNTLGKTGGEKTHVLTTAEMPSHTHSTLLITANIAAAGGAIGGQGAGTMQTGATGGGAAHNNLSPYLVTNFIIKT
jgi:microcystin-dependent protein